MFSIIERMKIREKFTRLMCNSQNGLTCQIKTILHPVSISAHLVFLLTVTLLVFYHYNLLTNALVITSTLSIVKYPMGALRPDQGSKLQDNSVANRKINSHKAYTCGKVGQNIPFKAMKRSLKRIFR